MRIGIPRNVLAAYPGLLCPLGVGTLTRCDSRLQVLHMRYAASSAHLLRAFADQYGRAFQTPRLSGRFPDCRFRGSWLVSTFPMLLHALAWDCLALPRSGQRMICPSTSMPCLRGPRTPTLDLLSAVGTRKCWFASSSRSQ
jgi:hypothetical protein